GGSHGPGGPGQPAVSARARHPQPIAAASPDRVPAGRYATITRVTEPEPDWRQRKKAATSDRIRASALRLFREQGYDATTVEQIAAAAGVSHMTFFPYFPPQHAFAL